jgi:hypothetical protein
MAQTRELDVDELKRAPALTDPRRVLEALGLIDRHARRAGRGYMICCPWHVERTPSCSVTPGPYGTLRVHCFSCRQTWDVLALIARVRGMSSFHDVLREAASIAGTQVPTTTRQTTMPAVETGYPPLVDVETLWRDCAPVAAYDDETDDGGVTDWLSNRAINPTTCRERDLCRVLPATVPAWAAPWQRGGYRCILPLYDAHGTMRSVRARRVIEGRKQGPKCLAPSGYAVRGLVLADPHAVAMLRAPAPGLCLIAEGETDYLTLAARYTDTAVVGVYAGSWTRELGARFTPESQILILTDNDTTGHAYRDAIVSTVRCKVQYGRCV